MKGIIIILCIFLISSCASSKKITKTGVDMTTKSNLTESVKKIDIYKSMINTIANEIDLSTIRIISYFPEKDSSTGQQLVKDEIIVQRDVKKTITSQTINDSTSEHISEIKETIEQKKITREDITHKKGSSPAKYYFIIVLVISFLVLVMCFKIR